MLAKFISKLLIVVLLAGILISLSSPSKSIAITRNRLNSLINNRPFYDADGDNICSTASNATSTASDSDQLYMLGDSITVGMQAEGIEAKFVEKDWNPTINAVSGKQLNGWGLNELSSNKEVIAKAGVVIVGLGTNDAVSSAKHPELAETFKTNVGAAIDTIKTANPTVRIFWTNLATTRSDINMALFNSVISELSTSKGFSVIDWGSIGTDLLADGIHPTKPEGYTKLMELVLTATGSSAAPGALKSLGGCVCTVAGSAGNAVDAIRGLPEYWFNLISEAASKYPDVDARLVAATLWIENRGWPDPNKKWATSSAGAGGPWQFINSTWASMGQDGDGDGVKDRNNPKDAVLAAFEHQRGSAGKPIAAEYNGNAEESFQIIVFKRDNQNLLSYLAKYNGRGAPDGVKLTNFPRKENADYVIMGYWLLATNFEKTWNTTNWGEFIDASSTSGSPGATGSAGSGGCNSGSSGQVVGNFAWPVDKKFWDEHQSWFTKPHHDYPASDIPVPSGTPVYSISSGTVISVSDGGACGTGVFINEGTAIFGYCHGTPNTVEVGVGQSISAGQKIMLSDNTGRSSGPHLHVQIKRGGVSVCPQDLFKKLGSGEEINLKDLPSSGCSY